MSENGNGTNVGTVEQVIGVVIDAVFPVKLPEIYSALKIEIPEGDGRSAIDLTCEVQQHLGDDRVRAVAMDAADGLRRGDEVIDTGSPITVPVGKDTPPAFLAVAANDRWSIDAALYFIELRKAKVRGELHIFGSGGHGCGLGRREDAPHNSQQNNDGDQKPPEGFVPANKHLLYIESRLIDRVVAANGIEMGKDHHGQSQKNPRKGAAHEKTPD